MTRQIPLLPDTPANRRIAGRKLNNYINLTSIVLFTGIIIATGVLWQNCYWNDGKIYCFLSTPIPIPTATAIPTQPPTATPIPTETPTISPSPTHTVSPTVEPPTSTPGPTATPTIEQVDCNQARNYALKNEIKGFEPNLDTQVARETQPLTVTWLIQNIGECSWIRMRFLVSGNRPPSPTLTASKPSVTSSDQITVSLSIPASDVLAFENQAEIDWQWTLEVQKEDKSWQPLDPPLSLGFLKGDAPWVKLQPPTPTPTVTPTPNILDGKLTLINPISSNQQPFPDPINFQWQWQWAGGELPETYGFQIELSREGETLQGIGDPREYKQQIKAETDRYSYSLNLKNNLSVPGFKGPGKYQWNVFLVQFTPTGAIKTEVQAQSANFCFESCN